MTADVVFIKLSNPLEALLDAIRRVGGRPLIVGGTVRDALLASAADQAGNPLAPTDVDVEVYGIDVDPLANALAQVGRVDAVGKSFGVLKVSATDLQVDVALPRREIKAGRGHRAFSIEPDPNMTPRAAAARRDFTVNAMAYDPATDELLDFFNGTDDLKRRILRHTGPAFAEDPLRVLRGLQLAGRFELQAAPETIELSNSLYKEYDTLPSERIWAEWYKWAAKSKRPAAGLEYLDACGWLQAYPELQAMQGCPQDPVWHPEGDVWLHTNLVTDQAALVAERAALTEDDHAVLLFSALCHDLGKPETTETRDGRVRSPGHAGCLDTYERFLHRIGCPKRIARRVVALARFHMSHIGFADSDRHVRRLARNLGTGDETIQMLSRLVEADASGRPPLETGLPPEMQAMLETARRLATIDAAPTPLLLGRHLIGLGVEPGPRMGALLSQAFEAQLDGAFSDCETALNWIRERLDDSAEDPAGRG